MTEAIDRAIDAAERLFVDAARARAAAEVADERRKHVLSVLVLDARAAGKAVGEAEHVARASVQYQQAVDEWAQANSEWRVLEARAEAKRLKFEAWRTVSATERARMQLR